MFRVLFFKLSWWSFIHNNSIINSHRTINWLQQSICKNARIRLKMKANVIWQISKDWSFTAYPEKPKICDELFCFRYKYFGGDRPIIGVLQGTASRTAHCKVIRNPINSEHLQEWVAGTGEYLSVLHLSRYTRKQVLLDELNHTKIKDQEMFNSY